MVLFVALVGCGGEPEPPPAVEPPRPPPVAAPLGLAPPKPAPTAAEPDSFDTLSEVKPKDVFSGGCDGFTSDGEVTGSSGGTEPTTHTGTWRVKSGAVYLNGRIKEEGKRGAKHYQAQVHELEGVSAGGVSWVVGFETLPCDGCARVFTCLPPGATEAGGPTGWLGDFPWMGAWVWVLDAGAGQVAVNEVGTIVEGVEFPAVDGTGQPTEDTRHADFVRDLGDAGESRDHVEILYRKPWDEAQATAIAVALGEKFPDVRIGEYADAQAPILIAVGK